MQRLLATKMVVHLQHGQDNRNTWDNAEWNQVEAEILRLDGRERDQLILIVDSGRSMGIGGGANGTYVCSIELPTGEFLLADQAKSDFETVSVLNGDTM